MGQTTKPNDRLVRLISGIIYARENDRPLACACLRTAAILYEAAVRVRARYYLGRRRHPDKLPCRVVSIGNLALGGTGKTPLCIYLAGLIHDAGYRVAIVSRGYKGQAEKTGALIEPGPLSAPAAHRVGDEPALMARLLAPRSIPIFVGRDRLASGRRALTQFQPDVILLDDGFQHHRLARDLDIVLLDGGDPLGNGYLLPRGPLREPPAALARADILILTRCQRKPGGRLMADAATVLVQAVPGLKAKPIFSSRHRPVARECLTAGTSAGPRSGRLDLAALKGLPVLAFAGIARNKAFRETVAGLGADIRGWSAFRDHYRYCADDLALLTHAGLKRGVRALVTTDKDRIRIRDEWIRELPLMVVGVRMDFHDDTDAFQSLIFEKLHLDARREMTT
ncbi:MAG: tetraacyldisaccharide 4'-kinase [Desulfosarcina sp.]|nr:tetraacyldisaccharide 4'-kinase [Desulfobacterales bacterium]